jgi:hypothetical protein
MAISTAPTALSLAQEACSKANHVNAVGRARDEWMEEIKADIWRNERRLRLLMTLGAQTLTAGVGKYTMPSDFGEIIRADIITGTATGTASAADASGITFPSDVSFTTSDVRGKEIFIIAGTGLDSFGTITAYNTSTRVATLHQVWQATPAAGDTYLIGQISSELEVKTLYTQFDNTPYLLGKPREVYPSGDPDFGEFVLNPPPDTTGKYVVKMQYFANLMRMDLTSTRLSTLYRRWRNLWIAGIYAKALQDKGDRGYGRAFAEYKMQLQELLNHEKYGDNIQQLGGQVIDYE